MMKINIAVASIISNIMHLQYWYNQDRVPAAATGVSPNFPAVWFSGMLDCSVVLNVGVVLKLWSQVASWVESFLSNHEERKYDTKYECMCYWSHFLWMYSFNL